MKPQNLKKTLTPEIQSPNHSNAQVCLGLLKASNLKKMCFRSCEIDFAAPFDLTSKEVF